MGWPRYVHRLQRTNLYRNAVESFLRSGGGAVEQSEQTRTHFSGRTRPRLQRHDAHYARDHGLLRLIEPFSDYFGLFSDYFEAIFSLFQGNILAIPGLFFGYLGAIFGFYRRFSSSEQAFSLSNQLRAALLLEQPAPPAPNRQQDEYQVLNRNEWVPSGKK